MTQQLELDLEAEFTPPREDVRLNAGQAAPLAVVLPFRRPAVSFDDVKARESDARVRADLDLVRLFM